jgi:pimeloyl-ACP methyl ester carboxylesterase
VARVEPPQAAPDAHRTSGTLHYTVTAAGGVSLAETDTVVLLHGWPGTSDDWTLVADAMQPLPAQTVIVDLRGFGRSLTLDHDPQRPPTPQDHLRDIVEVLDEVNARDVVVGGYDLGATLAQQLAVSDRRVRSLVLGAPAYPGIGERRFEPAVQRELWYQHFHQLPWAARLVAHDRQTVATYLRHFYTHWWGDGAVDSEHFSSLVDAYSRPGAFEQSIAWYRARHRQRTGTKAEPRNSAPLAVPTTVLWGAADPVNPARFADRLNDFFSDVRLTVLPGKGHFLPLEAPEQFAAALSDSLRHATG